MVQKVEKTPQRALSDLMRLCAKAERCSGDAQRLMRRWGISEQDICGILERLKADKFIDDGRYAEAFVREKINLSGWGAYKIRTALRAKGIATDIVERSMSMLSDTDMSARLMQMLERRRRTLHAKSDFDARAKLMRYALSQGYDYETARECVAAVVAIDDENMLP